MKCNEVLSLQYVNRPIEENDSSPPDEESDSDEEGSLLDSSSESEEEQEQEELVYSKCCTVSTFSLFITTLYVFYCIYSVSDGGGDERDADEYYGDGFELNEGEWEQL